MKKIILSFVITTMIFSAGCSQNNKKETESHEHSKSTDSHDHGDHEHGNATTTEKRDIEASTVKNSSTTAIVDAYLQLKNALVADSKNDAAKGATALLTAFSEFDMTQLKEDQHKEYMEIYENAKEQAEHIVKNPIDHQREHFEVLSVDINDIIDLVGTDKTLYQTFCPMASGGKGATWLSEYKDIKNPFFGSKMLKCGKVKKQIN